MTLSAFTVQRKVMANTNCLHVWFAISLFTTKLQKESYIPSHLNLLIKLVQGHVTKKIILKLIDKSLE